MSRYLETADLILQDVLGRAGEKTAITGSNVSDYLARAKRYVQHAYFDVLEHAPWPWALKDPPGVLTLAAKQTGTATITEGSTAVTLGATIATSMAGRWFHVDSLNVPYRITAHTAGTNALTLDAPYQEDSVSAGACTIWQDEYTLATDCLKPWAGWDRNNPASRVDIVGMSEMRDRYPNRYTPGIHARLMSVVRGNKVRIRPWPETQGVTLEYDYTVAPAADFTFDGTAATDTPVIPLIDRSILSDAATGQLMLEKNDPRAGDMVGLAKGKLAQMVATYLSGVKARLYVKPGGGVWR